SSDIGWAAGGGVSGALGLVLLYRGLSRGTMSVVAPLSAVMTALVPVGWGLISGERPSLLALVGVPTAVAAIALISGAATGLRDGLGPGVGSGILAGVGFGVFFILLAETESAELWTLTFARTASITLLVVLAVATGSSLRPGTGTGRLVLGAGALDMAANVFFLLAERRGLLSLVSVITALYPAATMLLARFVLGEQLSRSQLAGLALAAAGVGMIAGG
ncbi:MAG: DMT family transporter, partial [Acidimicrobiia bacterium]|nr:DMT family transporter [Acidimicrobiia bacterium]